MLNNTDATDLTRKALTTAIIRSPIAVSPEMTVREAIALMSEARAHGEADSATQSALTPVQTEARASCVVVVESLKVVGIFTERDLVRICAEHQLLDQISVSQVMTASVLTLQESALTDLFSTINFLQQNHIQHLPIVDEQDCLVGVVTLETLRQSLQPAADVHQRLQLEQVIANVATAIRASLHLQTILDTAVEQIRQVMNCDRVNIWKFKPDWSSMVVAEATHSTLSLVGERVQDVCYQHRIVEVYQEGHIRVVPDIYTTEMADCHRDLLIRLQTRAKVLLPLFCGDRLWGLLNVSQSQTPRNWQTNEINFLHTISTHLAIAIQQASTHEQLQSELQERQQVEAQLQESKQQYAKLAALAPVGIFYSDADGNCTYVNDRWCQIAGLTPERAMGVGWMQALHPDDRDAVGVEWYESAQASRRFQCEYRFLRDDGTVTWVFGQSENETDAWGNVIGYVGTITDITKRKSAETLLQLKNDLLARVAAQASLTDTLNYISTTIEGMLEGAICSILLLNSNNQLYEGASPGLPAHYRHQINGVQAGEGVGSCGTAVHRRKTVIVADIANDPLWRNFKDLALASGLRACWSTPIVAFNHSILGTFAIYYREVRSPRADEMALVDSVVSIVMLAIQRHQNELERLLMAQDLEHLNVELEERVMQRTEELQEREARYRGLMEGAADAILLTNLQGYILEANRKAEALLGYSLAELSTLHFTQLHPPEELDKVTKAFAETTQRQRTQFLDITCLRQDGITVPVDITAKVIDINGEKLVQQIFRDITDRKQIETALRESQQFLQTVLDTVPLAVFWKDRSCNYLGANRLFLHNASLTSAPELVGKSDFEMPWGATDAAAYQADDRAVINTGAAKLGIVETLHQQDGSEIWLETNKLPLRNLAGDIVGVLGTYQDITARRNAELVVERQLAAIEAAVDGIAILQNEHHLYLNSSHVKMFGYDKAEELIGKSWRVLYSPEVQEWFDREVMPVLLEGKSWQGEVLATRKDGTTFPEQLSLTYSTDNLLICVCQDVSERARLDAERKQTEVALRESEQRYVTLAQAAPVAIFRFDREGHCIYVNDRWCEMTGKLVAFALGDRWLETIHPDDRDRTQMRVQQWLQSSVVTPFQHEARILRDDGSIVWFYCQMIVEIDANGQRIGYVGTLTNISDRKAAEMLVHQQAERDNLLHEITQRLRQSLDLDDILNTTVEQMRWILKLDRVTVYRFLPDWSGDFIAESVQGDWVKLVNSKIQKVWEDIYLQENQSGRFQNHEAFVIPDIYQAGLQPCHVELLEQFQAKAVAIAPIFVGDTLWGLLAIYQNATSRQWLDWETELLQQIAGQLAIAIQQASLYEQLQQELTERQQAQTQLTERNQQLAVTNQELARATRLKDEFLANMSHELRTPLNAILGMTEGLQDEVFGIVNEGQLKALHTVESSASHLLALINDILDVAKIESGQAQLEYSHVSIEQLCSSSLTLVKQQAFKKHIQLKTHIPSYLPDLFADEIRMRQVLLNLLTNAVKFTPEGGTVTLTISLLSQAKDTYPLTLLRFAITDTGIGIAPENISKLFKPFVQIDGALNRQQTGTGLGLALVKQIVELHGGQVGLTSELGVGSCFTVDLPYELKASSTLKLTGLLTSIKADLSNPHIIDLTPAPAPLVLLAEDNPANVATISSYLGAKGYRFLFANTGQEAIDLAMAHHPDIILMDIQMPGMDGLEAMQQIRQRENLREIPIIALTALAMKGDRERCLAAGANYYLSKPVKLKQLDISIKELLPHPRLE